MVTPVRVVRAAELLAADPTPGMARERAYELPGVWAGRVVTAPGSFSGWHHHDSNTSSLYVVSGVLRFEFEGYDGHLDAEAGDFVHVPPYTVHRESNPTGEPSVAVIARFGRGPPRSTWKHHDRHGRLPGQHRARGPDLRRRADDPGQHLDG